MEQDTRIPTNLRTLLVLEILGKSDRAMTASQINEGLCLPKQTVHRLCATLEREGFLQRQGNSKRYQVARRSRELGVGLLSNSRHNIARRQILTDVSRQVRETVNFVVPEADGMRYLDRVETDWPFQIQLPIGTHVPYHCTASGKCFLASLTPTARRSLVSSLRLERLTPASRTEPEELMADLTRIARRGYSLDEEEFIEGMVAIAVPVFDNAGRFVAALAFHGPTQRLTIDGIVAQEDVLQTAAIKLREALFSDD
ncbi:MAG: IclR family transcriptional regulator [Silicimonas sp.]|nr:IclR family transcriptional regulator [Silicimonas sp.]